ncbi:MAG: DUF1015 family protein [Gammaproteobacteria bacterium]|nr:DUF1015 family protein [Gammaproteobacteria bacterium]MBU1645756.1 DUF1015 family protein [Gammaproteobacteria bacterium]MBU1971264.1 DUF1015 family protein [Gammaproteobacteria bacterium]
MSLIKPFRGLRPAEGRAADVAAPPYDVLSTAEARIRAEGKPWSFLHISKPEIDLPPETDPYAPEVYAKAATNLKSMLDAGVLVRDEAPCYYAYRLTMGDHEQTGLVVAASVSAYDANRIKKHEFTRPDKEDDRVRQIDALNAQTGPVLLAYPSDPFVDALLTQTHRGTPEADVTAADGIRHQIWAMRDPALIARITAAFDSLPALYIADGHHRSAAASRVAAARRGGAEKSSDYFLAVIFPHRQMRILDYNRVVTDLNGLEKSALAARLATAFTVETASGAVHPARSGEFGMYLAGQWHKLTIRPELIPADPVARLDVSLLSDHLLGPILGITDLRRDKRIDFVGGIRGLDELERRVDSGEMAVAFAMHPTTLDDLMAVADAGEVMPPKSTWFEPKLADGLVSHVLD